MLRSHANGVHCRQQCQVDQYDTYKSAGCQMREMITKTSEYQINTDQAHHQRGNQRAPAKDAVKHMDPTTGQLTLRRR